MIGYGVTKNHVAIFARRQELCDLLRVVAVGVSVQPGMTAGLATCIQRKVDALNEHSSTTAILDAINDIMQIAQDVEGAARVLREFVETAHPA